MKEFSIRSIISAYLSISQFINTHNIQIRFFHDFLYDSICVILINKKEQSEFRLLFFIKAYFINMPFLFPKLHILPYSKPNRFSTIVDPKYSYYLVPIP